MNGLTAEKVQSLLSKLNAQIIRFCWCSLSYEMFQFAGELGTLKFNVSIFRHFGLTGDEKGRGWPVLGDARVNNYKGIADRTILHFVTAQFLHLALRISTRLAATIR